MRSLVMSDVETNSEWSHLLGRAMAGPMEGKTLQPIVSDMLTWEAWREQFPETTALDMSRTAQRYTDEIYRDPEQYVYGFAIDGRPYMIPMDRLLDKPILNLELNDTPMVVALDRDGFVVRLFHADPGDRRLTFTQTEGAIAVDQQTGSRWDLRRGESIDGELKGTKLDQAVGIMSFRKAWVNFHQDASVVGF